MLKKIIALFSRPILSAGDCGKKKRGLRKDLAVLA